MIIDKMTFQQYVEQYGEVLSWQEATPWLLRMLEKLAAAGEGIYTALSPEEVQLDPDAGSILSCGRTYPIGDFKPEGCKAAQSYLPWELQNPWTRRTEAAQVYPLAACFYEAVTGSAPPSATQRVEGAELPSLSGQGIDLPEQLDAAICKGLALNPCDRWQNLQEFKAALLAAVQRQTQALDGAGQVLPVDLEKIRTVNVTRELQKTYHADSAGRKSSSSALLLVALFTGAFVVGLVSYQATIRIAPQLILGPVRQASSSSQSVIEPPATASVAPEPEEELDAEPEAIAEVHVDSAESQSVEASSAAAESVAPSAAEEMASSAAVEQLPAGSTEASGSAASESAEASEPEEVPHSSAPAADEEQMFVLADGSTFIGKVTGETKTGTLTTAEGNVYTGTFVNDKLEGKGTLKTVAGDLYEGTFAGGLLEGSATVKYSNGDTFKGAFVAGLKNGSGTYTWENGTTYQGIWYNGEVSKGGTYMYTDAGVAEIMASGPLEMKK